MMNINPVMLPPPVASKQKENLPYPTKQLNFGSNDPQNNLSPSSLHQNVASFLQKMQQEPPKAVFLKFIMPKVYPYNAISVVFVPNKDMVPMEIPGEPAVVKSGNVDLHCWFIPPKPGKPTILFCHGNASNISTTQEVAKQLSADGNGVMMVEYEGYGQNEGTPSESKLYQNAIDAAKFLNTQKGIPNNQIILMGHSLGGPIAAHTAASVSEENHFKGLILNSTVPDMPTLVKSWIDHEYIAKTDEPKENYSLERVRNDLQNGGGLFSTQKAIPGVPKSTKILVIHSEKDNVVDVTVGNKLMQMVKAYRPDALTIWEKDSSESHQDYTVRMPAIKNYVSSLSLNRLA
jgi:pimeloyl-ACP methyl ester carboxylesterase